MKELARVDKDACCPALGGIHIRNKQLRERSLIEDRAQIRAVVESHQVQHSSQARVQAQPEMPVLPAHFAARKLKTGPQSLCYGDGCRACPRYGGRFLKVDRSGRNGRRSLINHFEHFLLDRIDLYVESFDRAAPAQIRSVQVRTATVHDAASFQFGKSKIAKRERHALDSRQVIDAALCQGFANARIFLDQFTEFTKLALDHRSLHSLDLFPRLQLMSRDVDRKSVV